MKDTLFLQLVRIAMGRAVCFDTPPSDAQWDALLETARRQAAEGVLCQALERLPEEQLPSVDRIRQWMMARARVVRRNALMDARAGELTAYCAGLGLRSAVLKGQGLARCYPDPTLRVSGDIDLWIPGGREQVLAVLRGKVALRRTVYHHVDARFFEDVEVEVHFLPAFLYCPWRNRTLQRYFSQAEKAWDMETASGFVYPKPAFAAVFSLVHISKHIINEGVGLRQVMDHHYVMKALSESDRQEVRAVAASLGMTRLGQALTYVEETLLGEAGCPELFAPDPKRGGRLVEDILLSGNFGLADERSGGKRARFLRFVADYPSEVIWSPIWKTWHRLWRKRKGYL